MKNVDIISKVVGRKGEAMASPSKDAATVNLSGYLLKEVWEKCWEIRTTDKGEEYLFGKLPVGLQFDLSSFVDGGLINLPTLYDGLPIDYQTLYWEEIKEEVGTDEEGNPIYKTTKVLKAAGGGGTTEKVTWANIEGKPTWIGESKPSYSWSEITGKPNFVTEESLEEEGFLTAMDIQVLTFTSGTFKAVSYDPSIAPRTVNIPTKLSHLEDDSDFVTLGMMNGYATKTWVGQQGFLDSSDLNGYATETWVDGNYLPLTGGTLKGDLRLKDSSNYGMTLYFGDSSYCYISEPSDDKMTIHASSGVTIETGSSYYVEVDSKGIKVNGGIIKYNGSYWEIEGDVLVTGGITSYE